MVSCAESNEKENQIVSQSMSKGARNVIQCLHWGISYLFLEKKVAKIQEPPMGLPTFYSSSLEARACPRSGTCLWKG